MDKWEFIDLADSEDWTCTDEYEERSVGRWSLTYRTDEGTRIVADDPVLIGGSQMNNFFIESETKAMEPGDVDLYFELAGKFDGSRYHVEISDSEMAWVRANETPAVMANKRQALENLVEKSAWVGMKVVYCGVLDDVDREEVGDIIETVNTSLDQ